MFASDTVLHDGLVLPAKHLRSCGRKFRHDEYFLASAQAEADRLVERLGLTASSRLLDVGCGVGRLALGILRRIGAIKAYRGIDVDKEAIRWCQWHITSQHPAFQFFPVNVEHPRYNPRGKKADTRFSLPFNDGEFDVIYVYSVLSHMLPKDIELYLAEFQRLLSPSGKVFLTAFVEEDVPKVAVNPTGYRKTKWVGPLHCVRYSKGFFESLLVGSGFRTEGFSYAAETDGQSAFYIVRGNPGGI
ncbi:MAG TPA: class I SAM-dependent methyltransferase [Anaerolineae bacterium]|nr:class I SAM-dependent methyltransferase [Anaerolineae bacterium]